MSLWHQIERCGKRQRLNEFNLASLWLLLVFQTLTHAAQGEGEVLYQGAFLVHQLGHPGTFCIKLPTTGILVVTAQTRLGLHMDHAKKPSSACWSLAAYWEGEQCCPQAVLNTLRTAEFCTQLRMPPGARYYTSCPALGTPPGPSVWASHSAPMWWALWKQRVVWYNKSTWNIRSQLLHAGKEGVLQSAGWICWEMC